MKQILTLIFCIILSHFSIAQGFKWAEHFPTIVDGNIGSRVKTIKTDNLGNIYVLIHTESKIDIDPGPGTIYFTPAFNNEAAIVVKLNSNGVYQWSAAYTGLLISSKALAIDNNLNVYYGGRKSGSGFLNKIKPNGTHEWSRSIGANYIFDVIDIETDDSNNVFFSGKVSGLNNNVGTPSQSYYITGSPSGNGYMCKWTYNGDFSWAYVFSSPSQSNANSIEIDKANNIFVSGYFASQITFDYTNYINALPNGLAYNSFVAKYSNNGIPIWGKTFGNSDSIFNYKMELDDSSNIILSGKFYGTNDVDPNAGVSYISTVDPFAFYNVKWDSSSTFKWAVVYSAITLENQEEVRNLAVDHQGNVFSCGTYFSYPIDLDPGVGNFPVSAGFLCDIYINKLNSDGIFQWGGKIGTDWAEYGNTIFVDNNDDILIGGSFRADSCDFNPGIGVNNLINDDNQNVAFVLKLSKCNINTEITLSATNLSVQETGATYQWVNCPSYSTISNEINQNFTALTNGDYAVIVTKNGCSDTSNCISVSSVGINEYLFNSTFTINPNPTSNNITLLSTEKGLAKISIINLIGQQISKTVMEFNSSASFDCHALESGIYLVKFEINNKTFLQKVVIQ